MFAENLCVATKDINDTQIADTSDSGTAILFDVNNAEIIYSENAHARLSPASLTKVLTALVALKHATPDTVLTASKNIYIDEPGAQLCGIKPGDSMTLNQALYIALINSANDAALLIAENIGGTVENFVAMMNEEAKALGATNSNFVNPHGLTEEGQYTTGYDMYLILNEAIKYEKFMEIIPNASYETTYYDSKGKPKELSVKSTNKYVNGDLKVPDNVTVMGGKTGTTNDNYDRYFVGYTPYYVAGVWTGYEMNQTLSAFKKNPSVTIWDTVMTMIHQEYINAAANGTKALKTFDAAPGVVKATYCLDSGLLCSEACSLDPRGSRAATGYFTRESAPSEYCDTHVIVMRDASTGLIASDQCSPGDLVRTALIRVEDRDFPAEILVEDAQYVYRDLPANVMPCEWAGLPFFYNALGEGHYCGSSYVTTANNGYCYLHCDYSRWKGGTPTYEDETAAPDENDPGDVLDGIEDSGMGEDPGAYEDENASDIQNAEDFFGW